MKIAMINDAIYPFTIGGSEIRNHEIAKRLVKKGHEIHIYGAKLWEGKNIIQIDGIKIHGVLKYKGLYTKKGKRKIIPPSLLSIKLFFILLKEKYDLIDNASFIFPNCFSTKAVSIIKKTPLIFTWHQYFGDYLITYFGKIKGNIGKISEEFCTKLTKNNITVSKHIQSQLIKKRIKKENIKIIYNGTDIKKIKNIQPLKEKYDLIFVGRLNYEKNIPLLVNTTKLITKILPKVKVCIVGEGERKQEIQKLIQKLNLGNNFSLKGWLSNLEVLEYMKSSKIFVLPSLLEGFPLTVIEANACGLPVITTKTKYNNTTEYIINNNNGLIAKPNPKDFSEAITKLLKNPNLLNKMSKNGLKKAKEYDWDIITNEIENYYKSIL